MGPSLLESSKYYIWTKLPQILSLFSLWVAELCGKPAKAGVRHFPVMRCFPVMYGSAEWPWMNPHQVSGWLVMALLLGPHTSTEYV